MKYRFYLYRDTFFPGEASAPEVRIIETDDPQATGEALAQKAFHTVQWDLDPVSDSS
jgi:hypothetical protein